MQRWQKLVSFEQIIDYCAILYPLHLNKTIFMDVKFIKINKSLSFTEIFMTKMIKLNLKFVDLESKLSKTKLV